MNSATSGTKYDEVITEPLMQRLFGSSGYFNVGYWVDGITELASACDRLVDELAAAVPAGARVVLDVGCGLGATTRRFALRLPDAQVIGVNLSLWQLRMARGRGVIEAVAMDAARLAIGSATADAVVSVEAAQHFDSRADFFAEARRVLRPGGTIAVADMLFSDRDAIGSWMLPAANSVTTPAAYAQLLTDAGFADVSVLEITGQSWRPFCQLMREESSGPEANLRAVETALASYVLGFGRVRS